MSFDDFWKRFVSFGLMFSIGLYGAILLYKTNFAGFFKQKNAASLKIVSSINNGSGDNGCCDNGDYTASTPEKKVETSPLKVKAVKIISKPRAIYTDEARLNQVQGKIVLRVTFAVNGIGAISVITGLPDGLTEQAIAAARTIKFEPATRNGVPFSVSKPVEYTFTIY